MSNTNKDIFIFSSITGTKKIHQSPYLYLGIIQTSLLGIEVAPCGMVTFALPEILT